MQTYEIDVTIDGVKLKGTALYDEEHNIFDLSGIENYEDTRTDGVSYNNIYLGTVGPLLRNYIRSLYKPEEYGICEETGYTYSKDKLVELADGRSVYRNLTKWSEVEDYFVLEWEGSWEYVRMSDGTRENHFVSNTWKDDHYYCDRCESFVLDDDDVEEDMCRWCYNEEHEVIEGYMDSHEHNRHPVFFGEGEHNNAEFKGMGFELEVDDRDGDVSDEDNERTARGLCSASGLEEDEMRFAHDGSLSYGFECISQPHTVKDFWSKTESWKKMLKYLLRKGYTSHDAGTCGLHVHVSRTMFGKYKAEQNRAIAKVYTFFDDNWNDLVKVARRNDFEYCAKNELDYEDKLALRKGYGTKYDCWRKKAKYSVGHHVALNNVNDYTFEYRLGRGTLNPWSFFSWIDLVLTITKNARRITVDKVNTNDVVSWLSGITESTARYIYSRNAFMKTVLALYPSIAWSEDSSDSEDDE